MVLLGQKQGLKLNRYFDILFVHKNIKNKSKLIQKRKGRGDSAHRLACGFPRQGCYDKEK
jgi:hypothetical protein